MHGSQAYLFVTAACVADEGHRGHSHSIHVGLPGMLGRPARILPPAGLYSEAHAWSHSLEFSLVNPAGKHKSFAKLVIYAESRSSYKHKHALIASAVQCKVLATYQSIAARGAGATACSRGHLAVCALQQGCSPMSDAVVCDVGKPCRAIDARLCHT